MGKLMKGVIKFGVAVATISGICYVFKDQIKGSKLYQEYDVDDKINKVKATIKEKMPKVFENEEDIVEEDEIFFDDETADPSDRDYVSIDPEETAEDVVETEAKTDNVPTIEM